MDYALGFSLLYFHETSPYVPVSAKSSPPVKPDPDVPRTEALAFPLRSCSGIRVWLAVPDQTVNFHLGDGNSERVKDRETRSSCCWKALRGRRGANE